jgi:hypothetical protein
MTERRAGRAEGVGRSVPAGVRTEFDRKRNAEGRSDQSRRHLERGDTYADLREPIFILGLPRSFSWLTCAMIGQHPELHALPELQLFSAETLGEWWARCSGQTYPMAHGLLRAVAEWIIGGQSAQTIVLARGWLERRVNCTTGFILEELMHRVHPRIAVEKSPGIVYDGAFMQRAYRMFPGAKFIHFVQHPIGHGQSVLDAIAHLSSFEALPSSHWLLQLASARFPLDPEIAQGSRRLDPQVGWYALNKKTREFLDLVPADQRLVLRGEDLVEESDESLRRVAVWAGVGATAEAIAEMKHPARSPFACRGPAGAEYGIDLFLSGSPFALAERPVSHGLDGPVPWGGHLLSPEVRQLARDLGYR